MKLIHMTNNVLLPLFLAINTGTALSRTATENTKTVMDKSIDHEAESRLYAAGDLPPDPFVLYHPYVHSSVAQFEYSDWYYLVFKKTNTSTSMDLGQATQALSNHLARCTQWETGRCNVPTLQAAGSQAQCSYNCV